MAGSAKYRYPGPQEFEDTPGDSRRFFGRAQEVSTVAERIVASRLLVVYGSSGLGKSSLLKAGVFPKLRAENLLPVRVRLNKPGGSVLDLLKDACAEVTRDAGQDFEVDYTPGKGQTAWEFFRTVMLWHGERLLTPVLVFDQFEEIFTLAGPDWRKEFGREIGPLASGNAPPAIRERLRGGEPGLSDQAPKVKLVFCLREEYYGSLQELSPRFPGLFQDRFRLRPLDAKQTELAIVEPARLESVESSPENFVTPTFEYESAAIDSMLDFLQDKSQFIEPVPLQLLCQYVEQMLVEGKRKAGATSPIVIMASDLGGKDAMNKVIGRFYQDSINGLPAAERRHVRELCDTGLLAAAGNRLLLEKNQITKDYKVSDAALRYLTDERRILRQEPRLDSTFYEISHDTIARSIFESRKWRLPKQWRRAAAVAVVFMIALLGFAGWALQERSKAIDERSNAGIATDKAIIQKWLADTSAAQAKKSETKAKESLTQAEGMVAFLMGEDFLAKLRPMGRLNVFEDVQRIVPCKTAGSSELSDVGLRNLGVACLNEGDVDYIQFRLSEANERYETAYRHFSELVRRKNNGGDPSLAETLFKMALVAEDQLDLDRALALTRQSLKMQEQLLAHGSKLPRGSNDDKLLRDRAASYYSIGEIREKQGYLRDALVNFEKAIALSQGKDSTEWLYIQQDGLIGKSEILARQGYSARSEQSAKKAYECAKAAADKSPFAPEAKYRLGVALSKLPASASQKLVIHNEVFDDVASAANWDMENEGWARDLVATHFLLGQDLVADKQWDKAADHYRTAIPMVEKLLRLDPTNRQLKADLLVELHENLGAAYTRQDPATRGKFLAAMEPEAGTGKPDSGLGKAAPRQAKPKVGVKSGDSLEEFLIAQKLLKPLKERARGDVDLRNTAARLALWAAQSQRSENQAGEAIKTCDRALGELMAHDPTDSYYWEYKHQLQTERAEALHSQGDEQEAAEAFQVAEASIDRMLAQFPPAFNEWNDKFLLFYDHIAPFRRSQKDSVGELAAYRQALGAVEKAALLKSDDATLQSNLGFARQAVGDSLRDSGQFVQAQEHYMAAEKAWRDAIQLKDSADYHNRLFLLFYDHVAALQKKQKDDSAVRKAYQDSLVHIMKAEELDPKNPDYQNNLALAQQQIGDDFREQGRLDQAQQRFTAAEEAWKTAFQLKGSAEYQNRLFLLSYDHIAALRKQQKDSAAVRKAYQDSLAPVTKAAELDPKEPVYQHNLALAQQQIGDDFREQGQLDQAQERFAAAEEAWKTAFQLKGSAEYQNRLFLLFYDHIAALRKQQKDSAAVRKAYQDSLVYIMRAEELDPKEADYQNNLALAYEQTGDDLRDQNRLSEAQRHYTAAERAWRSALQLKETAQYWDGLFWLFYAHVNELYTKQNDVSATTGAYQNALDAERKAVALEPKEYTYRVHASEALWKIGQLQSDKRQALETFRSALDLLHDAMALLPEGKAGSANRADGEMGFYVILHDDIAPILHERKDTSGEFNALKGALTAAQTAAALEKDNASYQSVLGLAHLGIGDFLREQRADKTQVLESYVQAEQAFRQATRLKPSEVEYWNSLAIAYNRQGLVQEDKGESLAAKASYRGALSAIEQATKLNPDASTKQFREDVLKKLTPDK